MEPLRFMLSVVAATCVLGVALDVVTANIAVQYFTVHHPHVVDSESPWVMAVVWGIGASWWFGLIGAGLIWQFNRRRPNPLPLGTIFGWVVRALAVTWIVLMTILLATYAVLGFVPASSRRASFDEDRRLIAVALTHGTEYVIGAIVVLTLLVRIARSTAA